VKAFPCVVLLVAAGLFGLGVFFFWGGLVSRAWPTVQGRIDSSQTVEHSTPNADEAGSQTSYAATITYFYALSPDPYAKRYFAQRVFFGFGAFGTRPQADAVTSRYAENQTVLVHYHPRRPGFAVLEPGVQAWSVAACFVSGGVVLAFAWMLTSGRRRREGCG
jgi:hypothetical protein